MQTSDSRSLKLIGCLLEDEEILLISSLPQIQSENPKFDKDNRFKLEDYTANQVKALLRFYKDDLYHLYNCLRIPEQIICDNGLRVSGFEALCVLLRRLAYPNRLQDLTHLFQRTETDLSRIITHMTIFLYENFHGHLESLDQPFLAPTKLSMPGLFLRQGHPLTTAGGLLMELFDLFVGQPGFKG